MVVVSGRCARLVVVDVVSGRLMGAVQVLLRCRAVPVLRIQVAGAVAGAVREVEVSRHSERGGGCGGGQRSVMRMSWSV